MDLYLQTLVSLASSETSSVQNHGRHLLRDAAVSACYNENDDGDSYNNSKLSQPTVSQMPYRPTMPL